MFPAIVLECARGVRFRWQFDDSDFHRLGDLTGIGLLVLLVVQFADRGMTGIYGVLRWLQDTRFGRINETDLGKVAFAQMAQSMGVPDQRV